MGFPRGHTDPIPDPDKINRRERLLGNSFHVAKVARLLSQCPYFAAAWPPPQLHVNPARRRNMGPLAAFDDLPVQSPLLLNHQDTWTATRKFPPGLHPSGKGPRPQRPAP